VGRSPARLHARARRLAALGALAAVLAGLGGLVVPAAADPGDPSARDVANAKAAAEQKAEQAGRAQARLALARAELGRLRAESRAALAAYRAAQRRLAAAQQEAARATLALTAAGKEVSAGRAAIGEVLAAAYRGGGDLGMWSTLLSADGPASFIARANVLESVTMRREDALGRLRSALVVEKLAQDEAQQALATVSSAADAATAAKDAAQQASARQLAQVGRLASQRARLEAELSSARTRAHDLAARRQAALERARQEAERQRQLIEDANNGVAEETPVAPTTGDRPAASAAQGRKAVDYARDQLGKPYVWGASGPNSFDCSGLTMRAWAYAGIGIDHYSVAQYGEGTHVSLPQLRPGDLVFYAYDTHDASTIHHVGIYVGGGQMIEAPHSGADVRYSSIARSDYIGATRP
jgi:cell wall-associated NlpC family hydrolase